MSRVYNFSAGPAMLPEQVLERIQDELLDYQNQGSSVMEISHRGACFQKIIEEARCILRKLLNIPSSYQILFLQGGASTQFAMVPLNLMKNKKADYIITGHWAKKAYLEAKKYIDCSVASSSEESNYTYIPDVKNIKFRDDIDYVYICDNNTIYGTKYHEYPATSNVPLVADMSSCLLSEEIDVSKFGIIFAGAQKNIGPAGVTIVIIRDDLIKEVEDFVPTMLNYSIHSCASSLYNTPPTFNIYACLEVFKWIDELGGVGEIEKINRKKAAYLYDYIDKSGFYKNNVKKSSRSIMNVLFTTGSEELDSVFANEASIYGLTNLKGHRVTKGLRASIYNAMPFEGVIELVNFMEKFKNQYGENKDV